MNALEPSLSSVRHSFQSQYITFVSRLLCLITGRQISTRDLLIMCAHSPARESSAQRLSLPPKLALSRLFCQYEKYKLCKKVRLVRTSLWSYMCDKPCTQVCFLRLGAHINVICRIMVSNCANKMDQHDIAMQGDMKDLCGLLTWAFELESQTGPLTWNHEFLHSVVFASSELCFAFEKAETIHLDCYHQNKLGSSSSAKALEPVSIFAGFSLKFCQ